DASKIAALCRSAESLDDTVISRCIARVRDGLDVVTGLSRADRWPEVRAGALTAVLEELAKRYPVVIVDVSARIDPDDPLADPFYDRHAATRAVLDAADDVIVVGAAEPPAL
ncbi:chromosome partitioning protein, partial [Brevibacterium paucivorans]